MRIAIYPEAGRLEIQTRPIPAPGEDQVLVRVSVCGVCSTDLGAWRGLVPKKYPYSPGHEFCGRVERLGARVRQFQVGQPVVINPNLGCGECRYCRAGKPNLCDFLKSRSIKSNGGFAEYVALDERMVQAMPAGLSEALAVFVEPFACALHCARTAEAVRPARLAVFGAGMLGILTALALKKSDCEVVLIEPNDTRRGRARTLLGVPALTTEELTSSEWFNTIDAAIDCSGRLEAVSQAIRALAKGGRLVLAGLVGTPQNAPLPLVEVTMKQLELVGVWLYPDTFQEAIQLVLKHRETLEALRTEVFSLDDIEAAFARATKPDVNKVLVKP
jgi:2-desacetyl-2-hydroxyethyl bacteriochlorophyllide A dehydrogenase